MLVAIFVVCVVDTSAAPLAHNLGMQMQYIDIFFISDALECVKFTQL